MKNNTECNVEMAESKFTPGPWIYKARGGWKTDMHTVRAGHDIVATIGQSYTAFDVAEADGRLIARAPDMLRMLAGVMASDAIELVRHGNRELVWEIEDLLEEFKMQTVEE